MQEQGPVEQLLEGYERSLLDPSVRKSEVVSALLADSFVEFGSSGRVCTKAQVVASLRAESPVAVSASQFEVRLLASHIALVTYRAQSHTEPPIHTLRSSLWQHCEGKWQIVFHQGTRIVPHA
ncbi:MAG TPA: DUF4440 domain-containing protein [Candidatus Binatia bacterium]|nr:DUF4440 domain-containing protein [Candidatus Binatia bacterium]